MINKFYLLIVFKFMTAYCLLYHEAEVQEQTEMGNPLLPTTQIPQPELFPSV